MLRILLLRLWGALWTWRSLAGDEIKFLATARGLFAGTNSLERIADSHEVCRAGVSHTTRLLVTWLA